MTPKKKPKTPPRRKITDAQLKKEILETLEETYGIISTACTKAKISRRTFYNYISRDKTFAEQIHEIRERNIDVVEDKLFQKILNGDTASIIFYLKCKGKHRGWSEKQQVEHICSDDQSIQITVVRANEK